MASLRPPNHLDVSFAFWRLATIIPLGIIVAVLLLAGPAPASSKLIGPDEAFARAQAGALTIVDIRRPAEWRATGLPRGAVRATIESPRGDRNFLDRIRAITGGDKAAPIALICAQGVRSRHASRLLRKLGYSNVKDIREGVLGSPAGIGWLKRALPMTACPDC